tara:strand:+ start:168 stop:551 length:384 start_codon:yes stop_codon:yes gene_type:complete
MKLAEKANKRATTVAMERKQAADRQRKRDFENRKNIYIKRVEDKIMRLAEDGRYKYKFDAVPYVRDPLSKEGEMFIAIAKHFHKHGFKISYKGKTKGDKRDWNSPIYIGPMFEWGATTTDLTISWEN